jgi:hypothetical protein
VALRYDYAVFLDDQHLRNAMLTRAEARRLEAEGYRCIDVAASMDRGLPRFPDRRYVRRDRPLGRRWGSRR